MTQYAQSRPGAERPPIYRGARATTRLHEIGLTPTILAESVSFALAWIAGETQNDPRITRGILGWSKTNRGLRDHLPDWTRGFIRGFEFTGHPDGSYAISVASGDANTGGDHSPSTRSLKGPMMKAAVRRNQGSFDQIAGADFPADTDQLPDIMRVLLFYVDRSRRETRIELSIPSGITDDGRIHSWDERIILDAVAHEADIDLENIDQIDSGSHDGGDDSDDFDVPLRINQGN